MKLASIISRLVSWVEFLRPITAAAAVFFASEDYSNTVITH
jgi:hypothetical protein